eukprot:PhF_6_TR44285/c0_g1_i2/m.68252
MDGLQRRINHLEQRNHKLAQQLTVKQQELDAIFSEASGYDSENKRLLAQLQESQSEIGKLAARLAEKDHLYRTLNDEKQKLLQEKSKLSQSLKTNHLHVQQMIDLHAPKLAAPVSTFGGGYAPTVTTTSVITTSTIAIQTDHIGPISSPSSFGVSSSLSSGPMALLTDATATIETLKRKLTAVEESRRTLSEATEAYKQSSMLLQNDVKLMQNENRVLRQQLTATEDKVRDVELREAALQKALSKLGNTSASMLQRSEELEKMDSLAKQGLREEWVSLREENTRLLEQLHEVTVLQKEAEQKALDVSHAFDVLKRESDDSVKQLSTEIEALNKENATVVEEFNKLRKERDTLRTSLIQKTIALSSATPQPEQQHQQSSAFLKSTQSLGVQTIPYDTTDVEVLRTENKLLRNENESLRRTTNATSAASEIVKSLRSERDRLLQELNVATTETSTQCDIITHSMVIAANDKIQHLHNILTMQHQSHRAVSEEPTVLERLARGSYNPAEGLLEYASQSALNPGVVTGASYQVLYDSLLKALQSLQQEVASILIVSTSTMQFMTGHGPQQCTEVPLVPCQSYREPVMNSLFEHIGGLKHTTSCVRREAA